MLKTVVLFLSFWALGQQPLCAQPYRDLVAKADRFIRSDHQNLLIKTADGDYVKQIFNPEKRQRTHWMTFADGKFRVLHGPYSEWYDNGHLWMEGSYNQGERQGLWKYYDFETGKVSYSGFYEMGQKNGLWQHFDDLGLVETEQNYLNGKLHGEYKSFGPDGAVKELREYKDGELLWTQKPGEPIQEGGDTSLQVMPYLRECQMASPEYRKDCSDKRLLQNIYRTIQYPVLARHRGIEGTAIFRFVIEKDGSISGLTTFRGVSADIEQECLRVIALIPPWNPGTQDGVPVRVEYMLPIKFALE